MKPLVALIVAVAENGVIGRDNALPWRIPEDMKWFKARTMGKPCVMGRKTWESFPKRPLPGRTNIVVTRNAAYRADGAVVVQSLTAALDVAAGEEPDEIMVLGGAEIYAQALPLTDRIYLTRVHVSVPGDAAFPELDRSEWNETPIGHHPSSAERSIGYSFVILDRKRKSAAP
jgi:dihydrofolate reductase